MTTVTLLISLEFDIDDVRPQIHAIASTAGEPPAEMRLSAPEVEMLRLLFRRRLQVDGSSQIAAFSVNVRCEPHDIGRLKWIVETIGQHARNATYPHGLRCVDGFGGVNPTEVEDSLHPAWMQQAGATVIDATSR